MDGTGQSDALPPQIVAQIINGFTDSLHPAMAFILFPTVFGSMLVPLLIALFYFSTPHTRRSAIFITIVISVILGLVQTFCSVSVTIRTIYRPSLPLSNSMTILAGITAMLPTFAVDIVLLLRMRVVYPISLKHRLRSSLIFVLPVLFKVVRVVSMIVWAVSISRDTGRDTRSTVDQTTMERAWSLTTWAVTAADNTYASAAFLYKLKSSSSFGGHSDPSLMSKRDKNSLGSRIRTLFWIALTNFVFPVPIFIAQVILLALNPNSVPYGFICVAQSYVSIISVVFTTVWSSSLSMRDRLTQDALTTHSPRSAVQFRIPTQFRGSEALRTHTDHATQQTEETEMNEVEGKDVEVGKLSESRDGVYHEAKVGPDAIQIKVDWVRERDTDVESTSTK